MPKAAKVAYRPVGLISGMAGGLLAGMLFKRVWKRFSDEDEPPSPLSSDYGWRELLLASAIQGMLYALIKAAIDRAGAKGFERVTGEWPGT
ncbi:DUF4235 domain-containing protein [Mumia zhuanghuii]|uniref:DUF4235 domain-containing protein n=1 Tax=Mumia zhuanghuii TaxID=2585211 RepID=A0A5C4MEW5_9ACTN|nr:DUF4235 domain-containing protein [Mumia zhuanghuii]TNC42280.1 DUF4235 domain-containing protein [Mumia zhuanghuii]TNC46346.1 DUF4235 domain-containing protein [Mumia zhuanghuii]